MELTIEQALQQAVAAHQEGKLEDAERLYRVILQSQSTHPDANHNLGLLAVSVNKVDAALPLFKTALEANPKIEQFWLSYIDALIKEKQFDNAKQVIEQGRKAGLIGDSVNALEGLLGISVVNIDNIESSCDVLAPAIKFRELGKYEEAQKWLQKLIETQPNHAEAFSLLGHVLLLDKKDAEAERALQKAASINSESASIYRNQARLLLKQSKPEEALKKAQSGYDFSEDDPEGLLVLASCLNANQRAKEALDLTEKILLRNPNYAEAYATRAVIRLQSNDIIGAIADAGMAGSLKPHLTQVWRLLGTALQQNKQFDKAKVAYEKALAIDPKSAEISNNLGSIARDAKDWMSALQHFENALEISPNMAEAHSNLGVTLQELGRLDEAEASHTQAIALKPNFAEAHSGLGNTLQELGRLEEAEASYTQAIAFKSDLVETHYNLGLTVQKLGRFDEAEACYRRAIALKPDKFANAYDQLGVILQKKGKIEEAEVCYKKYMSLEPNKSPATQSKGSIFFKQGNFEQALVAFENYDDVLSRAQILETLYALGRIDDMYERIEARANLDDQNLRVAAIAAFLAERENKDTAHRFCNNPIEFIHFANISSHIKESERFIASLIDELRLVKTEWEMNTTKNGFQANINIFANPLEQMSMLKSIILNEIDIYYTKFKNESCSYIKKWPSEKNIKGWHVILKQQGHQSGHIHPYGWLSGVIYLMVVPSLGKDEGAIEFTLASSKYLDVSASKKTYQPKLGDIVFFPSSLHHKTLPFSTDMDRICVSFDLMPCSTKH